MQNRCKWCNLNNPRYIAYHDTEWGILRTEDVYLFEMLLLESFQAGLSWECVLNKRENFRKAFDNFDYSKIAAYKEEKLQALYEEKGIIRNKRKICASVQNARIFGEISSAYGNFYSYLCQFTHGKTFVELGKTTSPLSDQISADLKRRGIKYVGSTVLYSYLQAIGVLYAHDETCDLYRPPADIVL